jgi:hypothetical protein
LLYGGIVVDIEEKPSGARVDHALDIRTTDLCIIEYASDARKVERRETEEYVEIKLARKCIGSEVRGGCQERLGRAVDRDG